MQIHPRDVGRPPARFPSSWRCSRASASTATTSAAAVQVGVSDDDAADTRAFRAVYPATAPRGPSSRRRCRVAAPESGRAGDRFEGAYGFRFPPAFNALLTPRRRRCGGCFQAGGSHCSRQHSRVPAGAGVSSIAAVPDRLSSGLNSRDPPLRPRDPAARARGRRLLRPHHGRRLANLAGRPGWSQERARHLDDRPRLLLIHRGRHDRDDGAPVPATTEPRPGHLQDVLRYFLRLGTFGLRRADRARRLHAARPRREARAGSRSRTTSRASRSRSSRPARSPRSSRSTSAGSAAASLGATLVGLAFVLPSFLMVLALSALYLALRRAVVDAGRVLRHRRRGHRDHRAQRAQAREADARQGPAAVGAVRGERRRHRVDRVRDRLAVRRLAACWSLLVARRRPQRGARRSCSPLPLLTARARVAATGAAVSWPLLGRSRSTSPRRARSCSAAASRSCRSCTAASSTSFHWLTEQQFLDAVAVAMITPGPGRHHGRVHRLPGRRAARRRGRGARRFLPCYLFVVIPAPYFRRFADNPQLQAFVDGVTAAATGAIAGAAFVLGRRAIDRRPDGR